MSQIKMMSKLPHKVHVDGDTANLPLPDARKPHLVGAVAGADVAKVAEAAHIAVGIADIAADALWRELRGKELERERACLYRTRLRFPQPPPPRARRKWRRPRALPTV